MATRSSILAWEIPWSEEPGGLQSMRSQKGWKQPRDQTTSAKMLLKYRIFCSSNFR